LALRLFAGALLAFLFPDCCVSCGVPLRASERHLCAACLRAIAPRPGIVVLPDPPDAVASERIEPALRACFAIDFEGPARSLVHALKYESRTSFARDLAALALPVARALCDGATAVTHVPLAPVRRRERGFNQSALVARHLARGLGLPHARLLARTRAGRPQAESEREVRLSMRSDAFAVRRLSATGASAVGSGPVLLVDDVVTTGATMAAVAHALRRGGFEPLCLAVAATPREALAEGRGASGTSGSSQGALRGPERPESG
jgi:ComF family protein